MRRIPIERQIDLADVAAVVALAASPRRGTLADSSREDDADRNEWAGGTLADAITLARTGWPEGAAKVQELAAELAPLVMERPRRRLAYDVTGDYGPDVGRYVMGLPDDMVSATYRREPATVQVCVNIGYSGGCKSEAILWYGAAIVAMIDRVEAGGARVEVLAADATNDHTTTAQTVFTWPLKSAGEPLDVDRLAYWCAHPSALRRMVFAMQETLPDGMRKRYGWYCGAGYGHCADYYPRHADITFPSHPTAHDKETAVAEVMRWTATIAETGKLAPTPTDEEE